MIHKSNGGLSDARNIGIDWSLICSDSEWITFIDSDDWIHEKYLELLYIAVLDTDCKISICGFEKTNGEDPLINNSKLNIRIVETEQFYCNNNVNAVISCAKLYQKELFRVTRFPIAKFHEDEFTTYKVIFKYKTCAYIGQPLYFYYNNEQSITKSIWTPKRLDVISALKLCAEYLSTTQYYKAYCFSEERIVWAILNQIEEIPIELIGRDTYIRYLRKELREALKT